jgi:hypothetical protein
MCATSGWLSSIHRVVAASLAVYATLAMPALAGVKATDDTESRISAAMAGSRHYAQSHSIDDLRASSSALQNAVDLRRIAPADVVARRRSLVAAYAELLHQIESFDPTYNPDDPENLSYMCLIPPPEPNGRQLGSCADPNDIADPATRAKYITALNANATKANRAHNYVQMQILKGSTLNALGFNLQYFHARAGGDSMALDAIIRRAGVTDTLRASIEKVF